MAKKKPEKKSEKVAEQPSKRDSRDFSQRAYDSVREVEKRHVERHKDEAE